MLCATLINGFGVKFLNEKWDFEWKGTGHNSGKTPLSFFKVFQDPKFEKCFSEVRCDLQFYTDLI